MGKVSQLKRDDLPVFESPRMPHLAPMTSVPPDVFADPKTADREALLHPRAGHQSRVLPSR
jgi:hypothetical protein